MSLVFSLYVNGALSIVTINFELRKYSTLAISGLAAAGTGLTVAGALSLTLLLLATATGVLTPLGV